jgi:cytochrome c oxidase subunit IV
MSKQKHGSHEHPAATHGAPSAGAHGGHDSHGGAVAHGPTTGDFVTIFLVLGFLTIVEVFIPKTYAAPYDQHIKMILLCTLAFGKAMLVALFFMHLKWESPWIRRIAMLPLYMGIAAVILMIEEAWRNTLS